MKPARIKVLGVLASAFFLAPINAILAQSPQQQETNPNNAQIDKTGLLILIRQTLIALDLSNKSGNYTILREISAPGFAAINDAARLSRSFRSQRERGVDYTGTLVYEPQITRGPEISKDGMLRFQGYFPSASSQIKFEMIFAPVNGQWKLFGLAADLAPTGPIAPVDATQPQNVPAQSRPEKSGSQSEPVSPKKQK